MCRARLAQDMSQALVELRSGSGLVGRVPVECLYQLIVILKAKKGARASDVDVGVMDNGSTDASAE